MEAEKQSSTQSLNVLGEPLQVCSCQPMTGWYRDGFCNTDESDIGQHTVCCVMTTSFLTYSKAQGNDLSTPMPEYGFPGLKQGVKWCLCASRWKQAYDDGIAPPVHLSATHIRTLEVIGIEPLLEHAHKEN